ncbi:MAG: hypothetical protein ACYTFI_28505, partial [Planctomycetota bacterium]
ETEIILQGFREEEAYDKFGVTRQATVGDVAIEDGGVPLPADPLAGAVVDGLEDFGPVNAHVTWSNSPQPGTLGNAGQVEIVRNVVRDANDDFVPDADDTGLPTTTVQSSTTRFDANPFFGGAYCTRYAPESPFADPATGIVRLPGCRGALSVNVNTAPPPNPNNPNLDPEPFERSVYDAGDPYAGTIEVVFEDFYDPRVDGCAFGPTVRGRDEGLNGVESSPSGIAGQDGQLILPGDLDPDGNPDLIVNLDGTTSFSASTSRRVADPTLQYLGEPDAVPQAFAATLYHPWAGCAGSSALTGAALNSHPSQSDETQGRPWAVNRSAPLIEFLPTVPGVRPAARILVPDADGNFIIDAGVVVDAGVPAAENREAARKRAESLCDVRTRDFDNDFLEGALISDMNGDGLISEGAQVFRSELAAVSWNFLMFLTTTSCNSVSGGDDLDDADCFRPSTPWALGRCSLSQPQFCRNVKGILGVAGLQRNDVRAGGNGAFGRRDFIWHSGGELVLRYKRRNVFGVSADFAEDVTKTNWGVEFTWIGPRPFLDNNALDNTTSSHTLNLTVSVDRPTFINFLNANRTFFMNTQWFFQYLPQHEVSFPGQGPFNALFTFAVFTGYYQDRFLPQVVTVYDFRSQSGGFLPQISYRFTEAFSITFGVSFFIGRGERVVMPLNGFAPAANRAGGNA